jgi:group II intron reverse transcriptase/maturase
MPDELLEKMWLEIDWTAAEEKLANLQARLSRAAYARNEQEVERLQKLIVRDTTIKCLAVRHVVASTSGPGVDGVRWKSPSDMMRAALSLTSKGYHASPLRQILITAKNTGKERRPQLPTYFDRAMNVLYGYSLIPVTEALAERKSFAFRPSRSAQDAHAYVLEALKGSSAPEIVVCGDIKGYYSHIQHSWLMAHLPMDKKVLSEFLNAGIVFAGELFPAESVGISEGSNLSPYIGNFVLDGLQKHVYQFLHGTSSPKDYANGNLIRFADDVLITTRTLDDAEKVLEALRVFLDERGLTLSAEKTKICNVNDGFTYLSRTYTKRQGLIYSYPSDRAVERFIDELRKTILENKKSQRELILTLNRKLKGWAGYHRYSDASDAFRKVDAAVQTALLEAAREKHPRMQFAKVKAKYWYKEADGRHTYALPDDKSVRVIHLADTLLITHRKIKTNANPFLEQEYSEQRTHDRAIQNVTGRYKAIWERQNGRCYYCGRKILTDQARTTVPLDISRPPSVLNSAYIHKMCEPNEFELIRTMEDIDVLRPYDVCNVLEGFAASPSGERIKSAITPRWKYYKLKMFFAESSAASITLTFKQIEDIIGSKLPPSAKDSTWWYPRFQSNRIAEAWVTEGYTMQRIDTEKEKVTFHRDEDGMERLVIPQALLDGKLPANAVFELETHMEYIINKYGLGKERKRKTGI